MDGKQGSVVRTKRVHVIISMVEVYATRMDVSGGTTNVKTPELNIDIYSFILVGGELKLFDVKL